MHGPLIGFLWYVAGLVPAVGSLDCRPDPIPPEGPLAPLAPPNPALPTFQALPRPSPRASDRWGM